MASVLDFKDATDPRFGPREVVVTTGLYNYQITPGLSADKQRHCFSLLKTGVHVAPTYL